MSAGSHSDAWSTPCSPTLHRSDQGSDQESFKRYKSSRKKATWVAGLERRSEISGFFHHGSSITGLVTFCWGNKTSFVLLPSPNIVSLLPMTLHLCLSYNNLIWTNVHPLKAGGCSKKPRKITQHRILQQRHFQSVQCHTPQWGRISNDRCPSWYSQVMITEGSQ